MIILFAVYFFFFKQKTAYEMRISDWSSDVCSSDLRDVGSTRRRDDGEGKIEVPVGQVGLRIALSLRCVEALIHRHAAGRLARGVDHVVVQEQHGAELDDAEEQHKEDRQHDGELHGGGGAACAEIGKAAGRGRGGKYVAIPGGDDAL